MKRTGIPLSFTSFEVSICKVHKLYLVTTLFSKSKQCKPSQSFAIINEEILR